MKEKGIAASEFRFKYLSKASNYNIVFESLVFYESTLEYKDLKSRCIITFKPGAYPGSGANTKARSTKAST